MPYKDPAAQKAAQRRYYEENRPLYADSQRDRRTKVRHHILAIKKAALCADCKIDYPDYVLQFDHVRGVKIGDVSKLARTGVMSKVVDEIDKCDIVCANCHMHRTWMRSKNSFRGANGLEDNK